MIDDVLDLSKVEAGRMELLVRPSPCRLPSCAGLTVRPRAAQEGGRTSLSSDPGVDRVVGDARRVTQVLFNLLANAVKFTPVGGTVEVAADLLDCRFEFRQR